jgi:predicted Zn-ribbon and HTH transcriptional regulator
LNQNLHINDPGSADWNKIEKYKKEIDPLLIKMADTVLYQAKNPFCKKCGYNIKRTDNYKNITCPECRADTPAPGGDRVVVF